MFSFPRKLCTKNNFIKFASTLSSLTIKEILFIKPIDKILIVQGWVQAIRKHKNLYFLDLVDGTTLNRLQVLIDHKMEKFPSYGNSIKVEGKLIQSLHKGQEVELLAESLVILGSCPEDYPFNYRQHYSSDYVRQFVHLRPRTRKFGSILRVRSQASFAIHKFFQNEGFCFVHTPIITLNDAEGSGEVFSIEYKKKNLLCGLNQVDKNSKFKENCKIKEKDEFFDVPTYLTVSGQLHLEALACALSRVYNFGPVFRAENSQTRHHGSEFHMIEAEIAFLDKVDELIKFVEKCLKFIIHSIMDICENEVDSICENYSKNHKENIVKMLNKPFIQLSYTEAIKILENNVSALMVPIKWGEDLASHHKRFLVKHFNNIPVFIFSFPASLMPFYMKTDENDLAYNFDLYAPFGDEICGGSLRENNETVLKRKLPCLQDNLSWYLELRKYGAVPHGGFGIGFDRFLQTLLGISNIRDVIPFPRRKHECKC